MSHKIKLAYKRFLNGFFRSKATSEEIKIIYVYRYLSWALTSFVYLTGGSVDIVLFKLGVIVSLFISSKVISDLYMKYKENKGMIRTIVLIETIGITLLLLPTGGLNSPFIWYALNPTLVGASYLSTYFCWTNLAFYLFAGLVMSFAMFNPQNISLAHMLEKHSNLVLVFVLITLAVQLLAELTKKLYVKTAELEEQKRNMANINKSLKMSNIQKQESIEHIMSLYQIIEALNNHSTKEKLFEVLSIYTAKLTKSDLCFFWLRNIEKEGNIIKTSSNLSNTEQHAILSELQQLNLDGIKLSEIQELKIANRHLFATPILSSSTYFGLVAIQKKDNISVEEMNQNIKLLEFLAELSAVTLERFNHEDIEDRLLVLEEQNRIANEIHDSVSQRLFSISYSIYGVLGKWKDASKDELKDYLIEIRETSNIAMRELRNSIYKLSSKKKGEKSLQNTLAAFLDSVAKLHHISIDFEVKGDEGLLSLPLKKGITRIIREACGNAVRHGKCQKINVELLLNNELISLDIVDDGIGFSVIEEDKENHNGLGISNMKNLVSSFNGTIVILSEIGKGTEIHITMPGEGYTDIHQGGIAI